MIILLSLLNVSGHGGSCSRLRCFGSGNASITCDPEFNLREVGPPRHDTVKRVFNQRACQFRPSTCVPSVSVIPQVNTTLFFP